MKTVLVLILSIVTIAPLSAQKFGIKGGVDINNSKVDYKGLKKDFRTGFNFGAVTEFNIPLIGIGLNGSLLYSNQEFSLKQDLGEGRGTTDYYTTHSVELPVYIRKKFNLIVVKPFVQAGLYGSYIFHGKLKEQEGSHSMKFKSNSDRFSMGANVGLGCQLLSTVSVLAGYNFGFVNNTFKHGDVKTFSYKDRRVSFSVEYLF